VAAVDWPNDFDGTRRVLDALPRSLPDTGRVRSGTEGRAFFAAYGREEATVMVRAVGADDPPSAVAEAASFSMCDRNSRRGTAPLEGLSTATTDNDVWFSCQVPRGADSPHPGSRVLGWSSGDVLWLVDAPDERRLAALVRPMVAAAEDLPGDGPGTTQPVPTAADPYGLEEATWPATPDEVRAELARLPVLDGQAPATFADRRMAGAEYPTGDTVVVQRAGDGLDASASLAAGFGLLMTCARGTFTGTARGIAGGRPGRAPAAATVRWFGCNVAGAEGDPRFRGHVIGWTHGDLAWMVVGISRKRAEDLVAALVGAAGEYRGGAAARGHKPGEDRRRRVLGSCP
jgi:hypothetical protein